MKLSLLFLASLSSTAASLQRHRLQQKDRSKEVTPPTAPIPDRLIPNGINESGDECSCSPVKFTFRLALSQDCSTDDIEANAGIESTYCIVDVPTIGQEEPIRKLQSAAPVEITSVQFLEFQRGSVEVMYTDDSYLNASLSDGDIVTFYSSSSFLPTVSADEQGDYVPGGVSLILTGKTVDGTDVRNRFYWMYHEGVTDCLENLFLPGVYQGDAIGWVVTEEVSGPWPQFCPAASPATPTINPRTFSPTSSPDGGLPTHDATSSKSSKGNYDSSKSSKNAGSKSSKNSEDRSSKSSKSFGYGAAGSISMSMSDNTSSAPSESMSYGTSTYHSAKSGKAQFDSKASYNSSSSKSSKSNYRTIGSKSTQTVFSKSGKSSKSNSDSMSYSLSMHSAAPSSESTSPSEKFVIETKAEKHSTKAYKLLNPKTQKELSVSSKSSKGSTSMSYSHSLPSTEPSASTHPTAHYVVTVVHAAKSGKAARKLMSEDAAEERRVEPSSKSSKSSHEHSYPSSPVATSKSSKSSFETSQIFSSKSSKGSKNGSYASDSMSYSMPMHTSSMHANTSAKSGKTSDVYRSVHSSKSFKSATGQSDYSMSMPSAAPSKSSVLVDSEASRHSSKGYKLLKPKSKKESGLSSKSSKSSGNAHFVESITMSFSSPSTDPSTSVAPTKMSDEHSSKSSKGSIAAAGISSKSGKAQSMSHSMSMHSMLLDSSKSGKADSNAARKLMIDPDDEAAWAEYTLSAAVSKSSKGGPTIDQSLSMHSLSLKLTDSSKAAKSGPFKTSKSSKSIEMSVASLNYLSNKASKTEMCASYEYNPSKSSKSERTSSKSSKSNHHEVVFNGKSIKSHHSLSYSLSMSPQDATSEKDEASMKSNTSETNELPVKKPQTISPTPDIDIQTDTREPSPEQIRSTSSASFKSLMTTVVLLVLQFAM